MTVTSLQNAIQRQRCYRICNLWVHEENFSKEDVIFNASKFSECGIEAGSLAWVAAVKSTTAVRDFQSTTGPSKENGTPSQRRGSIPGQLKAQQDILKESDELLIDENGTEVEGDRPLDTDRYYVFLAQDASSEMKAKSSTLQISLSSNIANVFGFRRGMQVAVSAAEESSHTVSHVEISFRDEYLARADMWRLTLSLLGNKTVYKGQKLLFLGTIKATVKNIYVHGTKVRCAFYRTNSKPVFRSESAKYVIFIQMSREMWDFDADGSGDLMFNRVINGFLPDLLKRWAQMEARHLVSIILFTRIEYSAQVAPRGKSPDIDTDEQSTRTGKHYQDFYRTAAMEVESVDWLEILMGLKSEFRRFLQDVSTMKVSEKTEDGVSGNSNSRPKTILGGEPTSAMRGNILEAINMASSQFSKDYIDRDLVRTGISIVIVTPGTGVFEVEYDMLKLTTDTLVGNGIGIDLVCLSRMPLHSVPLFKYRTPAVLSMLSSQTIQNPFDTDSTPRQSQAHTGGLTAHSLQGSPSRRWEMGSSPQRNIAGSLQSGISVAPGSWSFALPHWIDVSFWAGTTDHDPLSERPSNSLSQKDGNQFRQSGNRSFIPRCRMYELQTMGVMESEMSNISIPYLQDGTLKIPKLDKEDPRHTRTSNSVSQSIRDLPVAQNRQRALPAIESGIVGKQSGKNTTYRNKTRELGGFRWMDDYDENVFRLPEQRQRNQFYSAQSPSSATRSALTEYGMNAQLSGSLGKYSRSPTSLYENSRLAPLERPTPEKLKDTDRNRSSKESMTSIRKSPRPSRLSRQISLGPRGFGPAQASASTGLTIEARNVDKAASVTRGFALGDPASPQTPRSVSRRIQASLSREPPRSLFEATEMPVPQNKQAERPSQPISIRTSQGEAESQSSSTAANLSSSSSPVKQRSSTEGMGPIQVVSAANRIKPRQALSTSGEREVPNTLSPVSAMSPWLTLLNPSNPRRENMSIASQFRRWQHIFPRPIRTSAIKWKSLCSPAALPLTNENFPTAHQLATEYRENPYKITPNEDDETFDTPRSRQDLVRELIAFRLSHGFQLVIGAQAAAAAGRPPSENVNIFDENFMTTDGSTIFMSAGNTIHQLVCAAGGEVEVKRFLRKPTTAIASSTRSQRDWLYRPLIRTAVAKEYEPRNLSLKRPEPELNWNYVDNFLAGYHEDFSDVLRFWRARFVLIPIEIPSRRPLLLVTEDSEEEIRLEGIRKLTQMWQKYRFITPDERRYQAPLRTTKDTNPLAIEYQTRDPSAVVAAGVENALLIESDTTGTETQLFSDQELYHQSNVDLQKLAQDIQGERGIPVMDRRWHLRLHYNCFVGADLVSWLLRYFKDVQTRDDAVELGNNLMQRGLFQHVQQKHQFRDGNFFFQIASDYRRRESRASWFGGRRTVPSTPSVEISKGSPFNDHGRLKTPAEESPPGSGNKTPTRGSAARPKVALSRVLRFDVDPRKRSYRPEIINLHYDRLHNPDNCYHIRIDWMNVTAKLIEDTIVAWATMAERYGLRLVELPIAEACRISESHPFRSPYTVKLALQPPEAPPSQSFDTTSFTPQGKTDKFAYHKALLKHLGFVLDMESKDSFPPDVIVTYSWGKPDYQLTQYVHKSGIMLAQITEDSNLLLLPNRLCNNRAAAAKESSKYDKTDVPERRPATAVHGIDRGSPFSSPLVRALSDHAYTASTFKGSQTVTLTAEEIKDEVDSLCLSSDRLRAFYDEAQKPSASPSPGITPTLEAAIPSLGLPPSVIARDAAASPLSKSSIPADSTSETSSVKDS